MAVLKLGDGNNFDITNQLDAVLSRTTYTGQVDLAVGRIDTYTAGENLVAGNLCYMKSDSKMWKAAASAEATTIGKLGIALETINAEAGGVFLLEGRYTTSGLTVGPYYVSETGGAFATDVSGFANTSVIRPIGNAISATVLVFEPDTAFAEVGS